MPPKKRMGSNFSASKHVRSCTNIFYLKCNFDQSRIIEDEYYTSRQWNNTKLTYKKTQWSYKPREYPYYDSHVQCIQDKIHLILGRQFSDIISNANYLIENTESIEPHLFKLEMKRS